MSTSTSRLDDFIGERGTRSILIGSLVVVAVVFVALPHLAGQVALWSWVEAKSAILYITVLTIQAAFLAAVLTIWTLMKTRASRYIERLAESAAFSEFIQAFEIRLLIGCVAILLTGVVTVADSRLTPILSIESLLVVVWGFLTFSSTALLVDSLLTARKLL